MSTTRSLRSARHRIRMLDRAMRRAHTYPHPAGCILRIETHISLIYLAGRYAYKVKKPVDLGFVDFSRLSVRKHACEEEYRLNRRLAPLTYLGVTPIVKRGSTLELRQTSRPDAAFEYAVMMRRFDERRDFATLLHARALSGDVIERTAQIIADFHRKALHRLPNHRFGTAALFGQQFRRVLDELKTENVGAVSDDRIEWCEASLRELQSHLDMRRREGFVRECHGDLHLQNIVMRGTKPLIFDCIEFDGALRWIDVVNDLAFFVMDLQAHGFGELANRALNAWLVQTGDYAGLKALRLFVVYRALIRALVETLKKKLDNAQPYLRIVSQTMNTPSPCLLLCHGLSGSGKSHASERFAPLIGAVRIASDIERKRAQPFSPPDTSRLSAPHYAPPAADVVYDKLLSSARQVLQSGMSVIVDATFLKRAHRQRFVALANKMACPVLIIEFVAPDTILRSRVAARSASSNSVSDADVSVLESQRHHFDPLSIDERRFTETICTDVDTARYEQREFWWSLLVRLDRLRDRAKLIRCLETC